MAGVKPRHAASLAFVGWYLLAPPLYKGEVDEKAPLKEWTVLRSFGTVTECWRWCPCCSMKPISILQLLRPAYYSDRFA